MKKKGDISLNILFASFVAIVSLILILAIFTGKMPAFAKSSYCHTLFYIVSSDFIPEKMRADQSYCKEYTGITVSLIGYPNCSLLLNETVAHVLSCWEKVNFGNYAKDFVCEELVASRNCSSINVDELAATKVLASMSNVCVIFPNNDTPPVPCGNENRLDFRITQINFSNNILIEFVNQTKQIMVS